MSRPMCFCFLLAAALGCKAEDRVETNKAVVRNYMEQVINQGRSGMCRVYFSASLRFNDVEMSHLDLMQAVNGMRAHFSVLHLTIEDQFAVGDVVVTRVTFEGTHTTGRAVRFMGIAVDRLEADRVAEMWHVTDQSREPR